MNLKVFNTHMELSPYTKGDFPGIEKLYTSIDKISGESQSCGYFIYNDTLYLPKGTSVNYVFQLTNCEIEIVNDNDPYSTMMDHDPLYFPRDEIQEKCIDFLCSDKGQLGLTAATSTGKGLTLDTKIPTPDGYKRMRYIEEGDFVIDKNGNPTKVIGAFPQGKKDVYKIEFGDGRYSMCDGEHLWYVKCVNDGNFYIRTTENLIKEIKIYDYLLPVIYNPVNFKSKDISVDSYTIGYYLNNDDIPEECIFNSVYIRINFLKGLIVNPNILLDGNGKAYFYSDNENLINNLRTIILSLALNENHGYDDSCKKYYISFNRYDIMFYSKFFNSEFNEFITIENIIHAGVEETKCIKVDSDDELFLTEDFIITHNTFCSAYACNKLKEKVIVITPNDRLKVQWMNTFQKMMGFENSNILNISGSNIMVSILENEYNVDSVDAFFVNHQTIQSFIRQYGGEMFHEFFKKIKVGIKIYDESHMNFMNILLIDFFTNTKRTWYLTATFDRSEKTESLCFRRAFSSVNEFGGKESKENANKHVIYTVVNINTEIKQKDRFKLMKYPGFTAAKYSKYAFFDDNKDTVYKSILNIINMNKSLEGKILIFIPLIEGVEKVVKKLSQDINKSVSCYHSKMTKDEKLSAINSDVIVSTIKSCGTGVDIKGLRVVICTEPVASKVIAEQMIGRLRPYQDKMTYFYDVVAIDIAPCTWWWRARYNKIKTLVKETRYISM